MSLSRRRRPPGDTPRRPRCRRTAGRWDAGLARAPAGVERHPLRANGLRRVGEQAHGEHALVAELHQPGPARQHGQLPARIAWAKLGARVGEEFPFACPNCGGDIRLIAFKLFYQCETIPGLRTVGNLRLLRTSCPRSGADPEDSHTPRRTARAASPFSRPRPAHRLGRARADARRSDDLSSVAQRAARDRHPQPLSGAGKRGTSLTSRSSARKCLWTWLRKCD